MAQQCPVCKGARVIQAPNGSWQLCPLCEGAGTLPDPGMLFEYEFTFTLVANAVAVQNSLNILNKPFKWMFATAVSTGLFTVQLSDGSTQRQFSNQLVHVNNLFGTAQNPMPLLVPYTFARKGQILAVASDLSGAPNNIRLGFIGVEINDQ